jgi:hypothetical protein
MSIISIGCQNGGPKDGGIGEAKVLLYQALNRHLTSSHCAAIDEYAIVLRVDGSLDRFGGEGLARLRFAKAKRYITIDVQVPEPTWRAMDAKQVNGYLVRQVRSAVSACVNRLKGSGTL